MYSLDFSSNPSNWLGPVWIIVNYLVWRGLSNYKFTDAANDLADKTTQPACRPISQQPARSSEYYHPDTTKPTQPRRFSWTGISSRARNDRACRNAKGSQS